MTASISRRTLIKHGLIAGAMVPACGILVNRAFADNAPVDPNDPAAKALGFVVASPNPQQLCSNCLQYTGKAGDAKGGCKIFPGKDVPAGAYCKAWVKKA